MGQEAQAVEHIQRALRCIETRTDETRLLAKAYAQWGLAATVMGNPPLAREKLLQADGLHASIGGKDPFISMVSLWAQPCFERSLAALADLDDQVEYARTQEAYGYFYLQRQSEGDEQRGEQL